MNKIDRKKFYDSYRASFGPLTQNQVDGINALLDGLEADSKVTDIRHAAYMLATTKRECGDEWKPIKEYDHGRGRKYGVPDSVTGKAYYGRGYVQLTWKENYETMGKVVGKDLVNSPDLALEPATAYLIMSYGMRNGSFTGVRLNQFIHGDVCDFFNARKIINGHDCAEMIAGFAEKILAALQAAQITEGASA